MIQNKPAAYGVLAGLLVFLVGVVATCASCRPYRDVREQPHAPARTVAQQNTAAVEVLTSCGTGSGVLVDGWHVLTAAHVINCADYPTIKAPAFITVRAVDGRQYRVEGVYARGDRDIARLDLASEISGVGTIRIRVAVRDERLCAATGHPARAQRCGMAVRTNNDLEQGDVIIAGNGYLFGNSGSGVYGEDGALVGVATRLVWCSMTDAILWQLQRTLPEHTCGGHAASIVGVMP